MSRDVVRDGDAGVGDAARDQRRRADEGDVGADEEERLDVRAGDPGVEHVADDGHVDAVEPAQLGPDRVEVEERLGRVLVLAVAGVDHVRARVADGELRRPDLRMAHDEHVRVVGAEREERVLEGLALVDRGAGRLDRHRVRGEALRRELEARRRARGRLVEDVDDGAAAERGQLLHLALERRLEGARRREQALHVGAVEVADRDEVAPRRRSGRERVPHEPDVGAHW